LVLAQTYFTWNETLLVNVPPPDEVVILADPFLPIKLK
jgi:hypothetical protein